jgi:hypothetical protein
MERYSRWVVTIAALCAMPVTARAEGKCLDDPTLWTDGTGKQVLVVTWTIPFIAKDAKIERDTGNDVFAAMSRVAGSEIPPGFPGDYLLNLATVPYPPGLDGTQVMTTLDELSAWEEKFHVVMNPLVMAVFKTYFDDDETRDGKKNVYGTVVRHPHLDDPSGYRFCTCTLQRAILIWDAKQEQLYVRSSYRSARDPRNFANFVPRAGLKFTFTTGRIWFPLRLNRVLPEPGAPAFLMLDILTRKALPDSAIPVEFTVLQRGSVTLGNVTYAFVRLTRRYELGDVDPIEDLSLAPPQ